MATASLSSTDEFGEQEFLKFLCRHVVAVNGEAVGLDAKGRPNSGPIFFNLTGFVIGHGDKWTWVTAGHSLIELNRQLRDRKVELRSIHFADYFTKPTGSEFGIPFHYDPDRALATDDFAAGLDLGIMTLSPLYQQLMKRNGICPLPFLTGESIPPEEYDLFVIVGFPEELHELKRGRGSYDTTLAGGVRTVAMAATLSDRLPVNWPADEPSPWLALALKDPGQIKDIKGMSGGPVFGIKRCDPHPPKYELLGVQSRWNDGSRVAFSTQMSTLVDVLRQKLL